MKWNTVNKSGWNGQVDTAFRGGGLGACRKVFGQVARVKEAIFAESSPALQSQERLLRLALNEAEAAARQTPYPDLFFPALAMEKVQAVIAWNRRQESMKRTNPVLVLAA